MGRGLLLVRGLRLLELIRFCTVADHYLLPPATAALCCRTAYTCSALNYGLPHLTVRPHTPACSTCLPASLRTHTPLPLRSTFRARARACAHATHAFTAFCGLRHPTVTFTYTPQRPFTDHAAVDWIRCGYCCWDAFRAMWMTDDLHTNHTTRYLRLIAIALWMILQCFAGPTPPAATLPVSRHLGDVAGPVISFWWFW